MLTAQGVARWFVAKATQEDRLMDAVKLLRLVYFAHCYKLGIYGQPLFPDRVEAWGLGPVIPSVYEPYYRYGTGLVPASRYAPMLSKVDQEILELVWNVYGSLSDLELAAVSIAAGSPWAQTFRSDEKLTIPTKIIKNYYRRHIQDAPDEVRLAVKQINPNPQEMDMGEPKPCTGRTLGDLSEEQLQMLYDLRKTFIDDLATSGSSDDDIRREYFNLVNRLNNMLTYGRITGEVGTPTKAALKRLNISSSCDDE